MFRTFCDSAESISCEINFGILKKKNQKCFLSQIPTHLTRPQACLYNAVWRVGRSAGLRVRCFTLGMHALRRSSKVSPSPLHVAAVLSTQTWRTRARENGWATVTCAQTEQRPRMMWSACGHASGCAIVLSRRSLFLRSQDPPAMQRSHLPACMHVCVCTDTGLVGVYWQRLGTVGGYGWLGRGI